MAFPEACNTESCLTALSAVQKARNEIITNCNEITRLTRKLERLNASLTAELSILAGLAAATAIAAGLGPIGWVVALILLVGLGALLIAIGITGNKIVKTNNSLNQAEENLNQAVEDFDQAVEDVMKECPVECWGDLTSPVCP